MILGSTHRWLHFCARIAAVALGRIEDAVFKEITLIRKIRNEFWARMVADDFWSEGFVDFT
jgi:hypothetical protein